jgi:hypothetical protein
MAKEAKCKCVYCGARHRMSYMMFFKSKAVCPDCCNEYRKIFHGQKNRSERQAEKKGLPSFNYVSIDCHGYHKIDFSIKDVVGEANEFKFKKISFNPLFEAFKRGWESQEIINGWPKIEIPESIILFYDDLYSKDINHTITEAYESEFGAHKRKIEDKKRGDNGISENS